MANMERGHDMTALEKGRNSVTDTIDAIEKLEELAAWHRMRAEHAGSDWVWEVRLRTAEDLERRAADLRAQQRREAARRLVRPA
jgi:hypothetical protein